MSNTKTSPKKRVKKPSTTVNTMGWSNLFPDKKYLDAVRKLKEGRNG